MHFYTSSIYMLLLRFPDPCGRVRRYLACPLPRFFNGLTVTGAPGNA